METTVYKKSINPAILYFQVFYVIYIGVLIYQTELQSALVVFLVGLLIFGYIHLIVPTHYSITRKTLVIHKKLGTDKEVNLMTCQTICDPVIKLTKLVTNPHALELYTESKERITINPKLRLQFVDDVISINKRIHPQVKEFALNRKGSEKKNRK